MLFTVYGIATYMASRLTLGTTLVLSSVITMMASEAMRTLRTYLGHLQLYLDAGRDKTAQPAQSVATVTNPPITALEYVTLACNIITLF